MAEYVAPSTGSVDLNLGRNKSPNVNRCVALSTGSVDLNTSAKIEVCESEGSVAPPTTSVDSKSQHQ